MDAELKEYLSKMEFRIIEAGTASSMRIIDAGVGNVSDLRTELATRMDLMDRRMEGVERTMGHMNLSVSQLGVKVESLNRLISGMQNDNQAVLSNQAALQRVVDDLAARVKKLEERNAA